MRKHSAKQVGTTPIYNSKTPGKPKSANVDYAKQRLTVTTPSEIDYFGDGTSQEPLPHGHVAEGGVYNKTNPK